MSEAKLTIRLGFILLFLCSWMTPLFSEEWTPAILKPDTKEYLPDYSYAGYRWGENPIPKLEPTLNITQFGAIPDDNKDDTKAIKRAIQAASKIESRVILYFPKGKYIISEIIYLTRGDFVIQGAGDAENGTVFFISRPLSKMAIPLKYHFYNLYYLFYNKKTNGKLFSIFSWTGGVFWTRLSKKHEEKTIKASISAGKRGDQFFSCNDTSDINAGDILKIEWINQNGKDKSLIHHIFGTWQLPLGKRLFEGMWQPIAEQPVTVTRIIKDKIYIKEPLLHNIDKQWHMKLVRVRYLENIGIENIRIEFPYAKYAGHHTEDGYNAIYLTHTAHSWVKNVTVNNTDAAILTDYCKNITIDRIKVQGRNGHYSVYIGYSYGVLVTHFDFQSAAVHDPSFNTKACLCVYSSGTIKKAKLDQHCGVNHQNLFDDILIGYAEDVFSHGGAEYWQPTAGLFNTFWNICIEQAPADGFIGECTAAPGARLVGLRGKDFEINLKYEPSPYIEGLNKNDLSIKSLYQYQLQKRAPVTP